MNRRQIWSDNLIVTQYDDGPLTIQSNPFGYIPFIIYERNDMPFINNDTHRRDEFEGAGLSGLCRDIRERMTEENDDFCAGDLAYIVYRLLNAAATGCRFERRNAMMAAVDEARLTWRRLNHDPAEDAAREKNGDVK